MSIVARASGGGLNCGPPARETHRSGITRPLHSARAGGVCEHVVAQHPASLPTEGLDESDRHVLVATTFRPDAILGESLPPHVAFVAGALLHSEMLREAEYLDARIVVAQLESVDKAAPIIAGYRLTGGKQSHDRLQSVLVRPHTRANRFRDLPDVILELGGGVGFRLSLQAVPDNARTGERYDQYEKGKRGRAQGHATAVRFLAEVDL